MESWITLKVLLYIFELDYIIFSYFRFFYSLRKVYLEYRLKSTTVYDARRLYYKFLVHFCIFRSNIVNNLRFLKNFQRNNYSVKQFSDCKLLMKNDFFSTICHLHKLLKFMNCYVYFSTNIFS